MAAGIEVFKNHIYEADIRDPDHVHTEFASGMHGQKLDFDKIPTFADNTDTELDPLFDEWVGVTAEYIQDEFDELPDVILGTANGTNRLSYHTARRLDPTGGIVQGLETEKHPLNPNVIHVPGYALRLIAKMRPKLLVVVDDVGTTGSNSSQGAIRARQAGAQRVVVLNTWQRQERLIRLDEAAIDYKAIINEPLPTYEPEDCVQSGFCSWGWKLIPRKK